MTELRERRGRPGGGRDARIAARQAAAHAAGAPFLTRALKPFEVLNEEEQEIRFVEDSGSDVLPDLGINISGMENNE